LVLRKNKRIYFETSNKTEQERSGPVIGMEKKINKTSDFDVHLIA